MAVSVGTWNYDTAKRHEPTWKLGGVLEPRATSQQNASARQWGEKHSAVDINDIALELLLITAIQKLARSGQHGLQAGAQQDCKTATSPSIAVATSRQPQVIFIMLKTCSEGHEVISRTETMRRAWMAIVASGLAPVCNKLPAVSQASGRCCLPEP